MQRTIEFDQSIVIIIAVRPEAKAEKLLLMLEQKNSSYLFSIVSVLV